MLDWVWLFNWFEVGLWSALGIAVLCGRVAPPYSWFTLNLPAGLAFGAFAWSDFVETESGSWWTPWWLFPFKASCVLILLWCVWRYYYSISKFRQP
jgi:hypothetical protein